MSTTDSAKVTIVNRALVKLGLPPSFSIDNADSLGGIVDSVWPGLEALVVTLYDWNFCRQTAAPAALADPPQNGWQYGFQLPAERIGDPLAVLTAVYPAEHLLRDFMLEAGKLYTNCTPVWVRYRVMLDPQFWDRGFAEAFTTALAGQMAVPMTQDEDLKAGMLAEAFGTPRENFSGGLFGRLIALNRASEPSGRRFMDDDPLTAARGNSYARRY